MTLTQSDNYIAFNGTQRVAAGSIESVVSKAKKIWDRDKKATLLVFDSETAHQLEVDYNGSPEEVRQRAHLREQAIRQTQSSQATPPTPEEGPVRGRGRPKLGVVAREVTLLPRQWAWLKSQPGGSSITLRKLVEKARKENIQHDQQRHAQDVTYRFMHAIAGDLPHFEEASRGLFKRDEAHFRKAIVAWPSGVKKQCLNYAKEAF